ncbi:MAG: hypothetical protein K2O02_03210 [Lachnospiraceae bacterium]|nr:hypothetical protein [Lachnospiraceae bacterium]
MMNSRNHSLITYNYTKTKRGDTMELQVNQVIEELSKIDSATEQVILSAENEKEDYSAAIESWKKEYEDSLINNMNQNIESYKLKIQSHNQRVLQQYRTETEALLSKLDAAYQENHSEWANEIFKKLISE